MTRMTEHPQKGFQMRETGTYSLTGQTQGLSLAKTKYRIATRIALQGNSTAKPLLAQSKRRKTHEIPCFYVLYT